MKARVFLLVTLLSVFSLVNAAFAQEEETEEIVLTTYYPAPYGNYDELSANRWLQLNRTNSDTGELRLSAPNSTGTLPTFWNLHNRGPDSGAGTIPGGDGNKLYLTYYDGAAWSGPHMTVTPAGEVGIGIGTDDPGSILDLRGALSMRGITPEPAAAPANQGRIYFNSTTDTFRISENGGGYVDLVGGGGAGGFWAATGTGGNDINSTNTGNVGIGTTAPSYKLDVQNSTGDVDIQASSSTGIATLKVATSSTDSNDYAGITLDSGTYHPTTRLQTLVGGDGFQIYHFPNAPIDIYTDNTHRMRIAGNGNVGIGTGYINNPTYLLQVNGSAAKPGGGSWSDSSDIRLKKNVETIEGALDKILNLRGVTYQWKEPDKHGDMNGIYMGVIAQEAKEVFPEWVGIDSEGYYNLGFIGFEALAIEAIKELKAENEALKQRIEALEAT